MAKAVVMPKAGITVESCIIGKWKKKPGDKVAVGDILFDYETDKASFECESTEEGTLLECFYSDGDEVPVLVNVCAVGNPGDDVSALRPAGSAAPAAEAAVAPAADSAEPAAAAPVAAGAATAT
ncbi:MAG: lipoyl domain-containing protein, partial [Eubacteriales bacterium]|nr:lipoyl domain-containing protein [Eubacteriales bacterium]